MPDSFKRKSFALATITVTLVGLCATALATPVVTVYKDPGCECCAAWVTHLRANGFSAVIHDTRNLAAEKKKLGVPKGLRSCHTATIDGYIVEGHVPAAEIKRLLAERPRTAGLAVPGMPHGSPGMETGGELQPYDVVLFHKFGQSGIFKSYGK